MFYTTFNRVFHSKVYIGGIFRRYSIRYSYMQLCIQLCIYKVYNGAQGYGVEGWAHRKGRGLEGG